MDKELIRQSSLLHDLLRYIDFKQGLIREDFSYEIDDKTWEYWLEAKKRFDGLKRGEYNFAKKRVHIYWKSNSCTRRKTSC